MKLSIYFGHGISLGISDKVLNDFLKGHPLPDFLLQRLYWTDVEVTPPMPFSIGPEWGEA